MVGLKIGSCLELTNQKFIFEIKDLAGNVTLKAYSTNPDSKCKLVPF